MTEDKNLKTESKKFLSWKFLLLGVIVSIVLAAVLFLVIFGVGIYRLNWDGPAALKITKVIPYPAVMVNYKTVRFSNFLEDVDMLFLNYQKRKERDLLLPDEKDDYQKDHFKTIAVDKLINDELMSRLAEQYGIEVSQSEVEEEFDNFINLSGFNDQFDQFIEEFYNWDRSQFKEKYIKVQLLKIKLQQAVSDDDLLNSEARQKIEDILKQVKDGEKSFEELAKEYGEDATAPDGGDLGAFTRGMMVKEFEEAAFSLEPGQVSNLVKTIYGYHVIKLEDKFTDTEGVEWVSARHILIRTKDLDSYAEELKDSAKIWRFLK